MAEAKKFSELTRMKYVDQAKWFLNGFWAFGAKEEAETVWKCTQKFIELDEKKKAEGNELDEFQAHKFLESLGETLTVVALREKLRKIDMDLNGKMALLEYLTFRYQKSVKDVVTAPQGDNAEEVRKAAVKLEAVQTALNDLQQQLEKQTKALEIQKQALEDSRKAEESVKKAEAELRAAVEDLQRQEDAYKKAIETLETKAKDPNASTVSKNKAAAELAQMKQEDPMPLRKAKITQEAALRKVEKERKAAEAARAEAENKTADLEEQTRKVEAAVRETEARYREAEEYLEETKKKGGVPNGAIWWMEREMKEMQKYMPKKKQTN